MLLSRLANGAPMTTSEVPVQQPIVECRADTGLWWLFYKPQTASIEQSREIVYVPQPVDDAKVEYYRNMAVDLNNRVAVCITTINILKNNCNNNYIGKNI